MDANGNLEIRFPRLRYDITMPICDGAIAAPPALERIFAAGTLES